MAVLCLTHGTRMCPFHLYFLVEWKLYCRCSWRGPPCSLLRARCVFRPFPGSPSATFLRATLFICACGMLKHCNVAAALDKSYGAPSGLSEWAGRGQGKGAEDREGRVGAAVVQRLATVAGSIIVLQCVAYRMECLGFCCSYDFWRTISTAGKRLTTAHLSWSPVPCALRHSR